MQTIIKTTIHYLSLATLLLYIYEHYLRQYLIDNINTQYKELILFVSCAGILLIFTSRLIIYIYLLTICICCFKGLCIYRLISFEHSQIIITIIVVAVLYYFIWFEKDKGINLPDIEIPILYNKQRSLCLSLNNLDKNIAKQSHHLLNENAKKIQAKLRLVLNDFGINADIVNYKCGPVITLHSIRLYKGVKASKVITLASDIARCLEVRSVRIARIPETDLLGVEVSNKDKRIVKIAEVLNSKQFLKNKDPLLIGLGVEIGGSVFVASLAKMPHLMISGTTGSGKSVCMHSIIISLLYKNTPEQMQLVLIDPKMLELSMYNSIPHLITPVVTECDLAPNILKWLVAEMDYRYKKISEAGVRNIMEFNNIGDKMPYIVVVIDEVADMLTSAKGKVGKEMEICLQRLAQKARASGIHLIIATQRPSVDVISGVIKANFPTRITFQLASEVDRRVVADSGGGAEHLLGSGDMLYMCSGHQTLRLQGPYVSNEEIEGIVGVLSKKPKSKQINFNMLEMQIDPLYEDILEFAKINKLSVNKLQKEFSIGLARATKLYNMYIAGQDKN